MKNLYLLLIVLIVAFAGCSRKFMVVEMPVIQPPARVAGEQPQVALVLGGGAFHGMSHVGVIKVLEDEGIPIDLIVGTSAGSMVGALYAAEPYIDSLIPLVKNTKAHDVFDFSLFRSKEGFVSGKKLQKFINKNVKVKNIEDTKIPFVAVTTDINKGVSVALKSGPIAPSVNASCAIPGIFEPVIMYGKTFVDGGVLNNIAVDIALEYNPKVIIAVNIMPFDTVVELKNYTQILHRAFTISSHKNTEENISKADIIITPDIGGLPLMSGKDNDKLYELGMKKAQEFLPQLRKIMAEKGVSLK